ncbi:SMP-30/gluconolactonase/LRE family protein [Aliifodinibius salicampi]|uniref:SMP-30/gluconolactonase/LRE family protein n=1 Tax=Fodinibius salicampi TaxID=1920655 RepID=A0ABT3PVT1_9BACT|nr:SMP-30/gluconolactonase/LRE family protein [Fodinibius salicampi]MCW9711971.1 SMP-30/gluconolactonase/LRE family protein [Fodinibius salicampi]
MKGKIVLTLLLVTLFVTVTVTAQENSLAADNAEVITEGFQFTEGPYWHADGYLLFSDIPANTIYKWTPGSEDSEVYIKPSGHSNGITETAEGHLLLVQHDGLVSKVNDEKELVTLADSYKGQRLNSPNDVTVASNGTIYFTDPPFGVSDEDKELAFSGVYKLVEGEEPELLFDGFDTPNGVVLNREESKIYVNNTSSGDIMVFERAADGTFEDGEQFANVGASSDTGAADGMVVDEEGRVYSTGPGGIFIFSSDGNQVEKIDLPARATNMEWGGNDFATLFITTPSAVYRLPMNVKGVKK